MNLSARNIPHSPLACALPLCGVVSAFQPYFYGSKQLEQKRKGSGAADTESGYESTSDSDFVIVWASELNDRFLGRSDYDSDCSQSSFLSR